MKANIPSACITLLMLLVCQITSGQISDSLPHKKLIHQVEFDVAPNFVFQTKDFLKGKKYGWYANRICNLESGSDPLPE